MGIIKKYELGRVEIAFIIVILAAVVLAGLYVWRLGNEKESSIDSFAECVAAGNPVMESYPEQCAANGQTWTNPDQTAVEPLEPYTATDNELAFHELPADLQEAVKVNLAEYCSAEIAQHGDTVYTYAVANRDQFVEGKYAMVSLSCGAGSSASLYAVKEGVWKFVGSAQDSWACTSLVEFNIPRSYIAECYEAPGEAAVANPVQ